MAGFKSKVGWEGRGLRGHQVERRRSGGHQGHGQERVRRRSKAWSGEGQSHGQEEAMRRSKEVMKGSEKRSGCQSQEQEKIRRRSTRS